MGASWSASDRSAHTGAHGKLGFTWGVGETQGWRPTMEDAFVATCFGGQGAWTDAALFGVFDGHGGAQVAEFCAEQLPKFVAEGNPSMAAVVLRDSFLHVEKMLIDLGRDTSPSDPGHPDNVGCTAVVSLITPEIITVANAGDSRAVLCRSGRAIALSHDHKPNLPKETARIHKAGGFVTHQKCGPHDVVHRVNGKLSLSRSIGDLIFKKNTELQAGEQLVSCVPDVKNFRRQSEDEFMVIACDGVWDVMTSQQVVDRVRKDIVKIRCGYSQPEAVVKEILKECVSADPSHNFGRGSDNMTMILVVFSSGGGLPGKPQCGLPGVITSCLHPSKSFVKSGSCSHATKSILPRNQEASPSSAGDAKEQRRDKLKESSVDTTHGTLGAFGIQKNVEKECSWKRYRSQPN